MNYKQIIIDNLKQTKLFSSIVAETNYQLMLKFDPTFENYFFNVYLPTFRYNKFSLIRSDYTNDTEANLLNTAWSSYKHKPTNLSAHLIT